MILDSLFAPQAFTTAELHEIAEALTKPAVVKYFKNELATGFKGIANGRPKDDETDTAYLRRQATVTGANLVWEQLLSIQKPQQST